MRQVKLIGPQMVFAPPKGGKLRDMPLPDVVSDALAAHITRRPSIDVTLPWKTPDGPPVTAKLLFYSRERKALNRNYFNMYLWKPALIAAGVIPERVPGERFTPSREHGTRRSCWTRERTSRPWPSTSATPTRVSRPGRTRT